MRLKNADLYETWRQIGRGKTKHPEDIILHEFGAEYVFTDRKHKRFIKIARKSKRMKEVFSDAQTMVFRVLDAVGAEGEP
jgi:hypothetical protein